jgi:thiosulfate reductase cytochrome b subunit
LANLPLELVAVAHASAAYLVLIFLIGHIYLTSTGHTPAAHIKAMITGWEEVEDEGEQESRV